MTVTDVPRYKRVIDSIIADIVSERYKIGQKLPSDRKLANQLNVSPVTVSKAYNLLVEQGYLKRVRGAGTFVASKRKRTNTVIFVADRTKKEWTGRITSGFTEVMAENEYEVQIAPDIGVEPIREKIFVDSVDTEKIDGIFVFAGSVTEKYYLDLMNKSKIAILLGGGRFRHIPYVKFNDYKIGQLAAEFLIEKGVKSFGVITEDFPDGRERLFGFREAISRAGFDLPEDRIIWARQSKFLTRDEIDNIINKWKPFPQGIFSHGDSYLVHLYHQYLNGIANIPDETIFVGVGNDFSHHHIPFTSIDYNLHNLGRIAAEYLLELIEKGTTVTLGKPLYRMPEPEIKIRLAQICKYKFLPVGD